MTAYREHSNHLEQPITIYTRDFVEPARVIQIDSDGRLAVDTVSGSLYLSYGEGSNKE